MRFSPRSALPLAALALILSLSGCRCGGPEGPAVSLEERVPADVLGLLQVPDTGALQLQLAGLNQRFQVSFPDLQRMVVDARGRLGFDPLDPKTLAPLGLDPKGGLIVAVHPAWVLVGLEVADPALFDKTLRERSAKELPNELVFEETTVAGQPCVVVRPKSPEAAPAVFAYATVGKQMLFVPGKSAADLPVDPVGALGGILATAKERSLAAQPAYRAQSGAVKDKASVTLWLNTVPLAKLAGEKSAAAGKTEEKRFFEGVEKALRGLALGLSISPEGLNLVGKATVEPKQYALMQTHFLSGKPGPDFSKMVGGDAVLFARAAFQPAKVFGFIKGFMPAKQKKELQEYLNAAKAAGFDVEADVLAALSGHMAFAFHNVDLSGGVQRVLARPEGMSPSLIDSATYFQVADKAKLEALLQRVSTGAQEQGLSVEQELREGVQVTTVKQGTVALASWLRKDDLLVVATGTGRADKVIAGLQGKLPALAAAKLDPAATRAASVAGEGGLVLNLRNLMTAFPILGLMVPKAALTLNNLGALSLRVAMDADGMQGELGLSFTPQAQPSPAPVK